ncbi:MAG: ECF transporter S component [Dethiosulfovibrio peptidovorans]|nr:MAG: ECF transporter S component [Dethiosulfovibrio peptidovorans]
MRKDITRSIALGALGIAMVAGATILSVPVPGFRLYFNLGEGIIYTVAILLGPRLGCICGGLGAALADLILGYPLWAPLTLLIKGLEGYAVGSLAPKGRIRALATGAAIMAGGYSLSAGLLYGWAAAPIELGTDIIQTGIGAAIALPLSTVLRHRILSKKLTD